MQLAELLLRLNDLYEQAETCIEYFAHPLNYKNRQPYQMIADANRFLAYLKKEHRKLEKEGLQVVVDSQPSRVTKLTQEEIEDLSWAVRPD